MKINKVYQGDCLEVMAKFPDNSIDTVITDPPYALTNRIPDVKKCIDCGRVLGEKDGNPDKCPKCNGVLQRQRTKQRGFMGKKWDNDIAFDPAVWRECLRVAKPGATLMAFGGTRTHHRLMVAIEDAGWEIRDCISHFHSSDEREIVLLDSMNEDQIQAYLELHYPNEMLAWAYGSGFPKSTSVSKQLDKTNGKTVEDIKILKDELQRVFDVSALTLAQLNEQCGFEASGYLRKSSTWALVLPSLEKWQSMRNVIGTNDDFSSEFKEAERKIIGKLPWTNSSTHFNSSKPDPKRVQLDITAPSTDLAKQFDGYGTALKPAWEPIIVAQKPIEGTYANNAEKWNVAGLNVDGGRVGTGDNLNGGAYTGNGRKNRFFKGLDDTGEEYKRPKGRFPANLILSHSEGCVLRGVKKIKGHLGYPNGPGGGQYKSMEMIGGHHSEVFKNSPVDSYANPDGYETTEDWDCEPDCAVRLLDEGSGELKSGEKKLYHRQNVGPGSKGKTMSGGWQSETMTSLHKASQGGASRFFKNFPPARFIYSGKAGKKERGEGNTHPTVKSLKVLEYLCTLTRTPTGGIVLDPFAGSGTTALAALSTGRDWVLIEKEGEYVEITLERIKAFREAMPEGEQMGLELSDE